MGVSPMFRTPIASIALALSLGAFADAQVLPGRDPAAGGPPASPAQRSLFGRPAAGQEAPASDNAPGATPPGLSLTPAPTAPGAPAITPPGDSAPVAEEDRIFENGAVLPEPATPETMGQPTITLPTEPIEPYLLRRENGPFMVLAKTFQGPDAARYAQALAMELRSQHGLPAYVWYLRLQPGHSNIRNVPPTAPDYIRSGETIGPPERYRAYDEAAVLVGDCKTIDESEDLLHRVKKIHSVVVDGTPSLWKWKWRKGLSRAMLTTNPLRASQELYPVKDADGHPNPHQHPAGGPPIALQNGQAVDPYVLTAGLQNASKDDPLIKRMNDPKVNRKSLYNCPGPYALQVAEFLGRATTDTNDPRFLSQDLLKQSPLATAAEEAEQLAENLARCQTLPKGLQPYVFHDRSSSRVLLGPIHRADDPNLPAIIEQLNLQVSNELFRRQFTKLPLAPAQQLTPVPRP